MKQKSIGESAFNFFNYIGFSLFALICAYPFYFIFLSSISLNETGKRNYFWPMQGVTFKNYESMLNQSHLLNSIVVSLSRVVIGVVLTVLISSLMAYLMTKNELPGRKIIYRFLVVSMYLAPGVIPTYITYKTLGLNNTFFVYVLPGALSAYYVILIKTYIESMDPGVEESAAIDGCGYVRFFIKFVLPLSKPILAAVTVFVAVGQWNSWYDNFIFVNSPKLQTLQYTCYQMLQQANALMQRAMSGEKITDLNFASISPESIRMAISVLTILPVMMFYPLLQKNFVKGIMLGAVKG